MWIMASIILLGLVLAALFIWNGILMLRAWRNQREALLRKRSANR